MKYLLRVTMIALMGVALFGCASNGTTGPSSGGTQAEQTGGGGGTSGVGENGAMQGQPLSGQNGQQASQQQGPPQKDMIHFAFDSSTIKDKFLPLLQKHATYLMNHPQQKVTLEGNTDPRGTREYNMALGQRRAESVKSLLMSDGVSADQLSTVSYGEERPAVSGPNDNPKAWAKDRRVKIDYQQQ
ncbi:MAG TPA: peptidoglycan-associated lipoprotein Pal [Gammaproteobacteria bacterium]|nr:peptidoglycan-associated lipoprotein Pal [Gammaproteobacteria bacterium]